MNGWHELIGRPLCMDYRELTSQLPDGCIDLLFLDPPYNIGVFCKMPADEYLDWCREWIAEGDRILAPNGAFWVSHKAPDVLVDISREIARLGRGQVNWVTWDKYNGAGPGEQYVMNKTKLHPQGKRSFDQDAEYLVYHADEGDWTAQCDRQRGFIFEPLRAYLASEWERAGLRPKDANVATSSQMSGHYLTRVQWALPTAEKYAQLRAYANRHGNHGGEYLRREYEYLRREYEGLRYTFNNPGKVSSVWQIPPASRNGHPSPKPEVLLDRIIKATSNEGDLVCDFFAGSFTTAVVAQKLNRRWICCDKEEKYVELGRQRLAQPLLL